MQKIVHLTREGGLRATIARGVAYLYRRRIRPFLPPVGAAEYSAIPTGHTKRWLDRHVPELWVPYTDRDIPDYEETLLQALRHSVRSGDRVVIVGGGAGVSAVTAARLAGPGGSVRCYEGAAECVTRVRRTAEMNGVGDLIRVDHAVVGLPVSVYGSEPAQGGLPPDQLRECDVLELDCEGAELLILREMTIRPRVVIVESHGMLGCGSAEVAEELEQLGYDAHISGVAEPRERNFCKQNDIRIVVGTYILEGGAGA